MPVFEYKCAECGKVSEFLEKSGNRSVRTCPHCGGVELKKQYSVFAAGVKQGDSKRCNGCSDQSCPHSGY